MGYVVRIKDPTIRRAEIAARVKDARDSNNYRTEHKFHNGERLPVIVVPIDDLLYRLENYRTRDKQLSLIAKGKFEPGFFDPSRREDPSVQQQQHEILLTLAQRGSGESIKPIYSELERACEQTDDLIISADGVVVNGNRRLSAMRELFHSGDSRFSKFENITCSVLPSSASPEDILKLEIGLQMQPETKLPYEWTALGRAVRDLRNTGMGDGKIAELMNRDEKEILRASKMIDSADLYLTDWLTAPDDYDKLEGTEQAFIQIATRNLSKTDNAELREITRKFDFFVVENREDIEDLSAYNLINAIEANPELFLGTLAKELDIDLPVTPAKKNSQFKISFDTQHTETNKDFTPLVDALSAAREDKSKSSETLKTITNVCRIVSEQNKALDKAALKFAKNAEKALSAIDLQTANPNSYSDIDSTLSKCIELAERLIANISARSSQSDNG